MVWRQKINNCLQTGRNLQILAAASERLTFTKKKMFQITPPKVEHIATSA